MERAVYVNMAEVEDEHWWFVARRRILGKLIERTANLPKPARVLEAGCGTGGNLPMFARFGAVCAFEPDEGARSYAPWITAVGPRPLETPTSARS